MNLWSLLLDIRVVLGIALIATGIYAKVQSLRVDQIKAEYAQFRADVESEAAKAKVAAAQEAARQAQAAQEVLSDLQTRNASLSARYERLRRDSAGGRTVPSVPGAAPSAAACSCGQPDAITRFVPEGRCLAALEAGDREIAKYRELWRLQLRNSGSAI